MPAYLIFAFVVIASTPLIGKTFSHYRIVEKIGAGGMGRVYRALDRRLERDVAVKLLAPDATGDRTATERLLREARAASALHHPNVVAIHGVEEIDGAPIPEQPPDLRDELHRPRIEKPDRVESPESHDLVPA